MKKFIVYKGVKIYDGDYIIGSIQERKVTGRLSINTGDTRRAYFCQNEKDGSRANDLKGFMYSWVFSVNVDGIINDDVVINLKTNKKLTNEEKISSIIIPPHIVQQKEKEENKKKILSIKKLMGANFNYIENYKKTITEQELEIKKLEKINKSIKIKPVKNWLNIMLKSLKKNPKINKITIKNGEIIIKTNDLIYKHKNIDVPNYNMGAFYIKLLPSNYIRIVNYKKQYKQGIYYHPNIKIDFYCCFGETVKRSINTFINNGDLDLAVNLIILFLEEPNYAVPYIKAELFACAQPVTLRDNPTILFNKKSWEKEKWDSSKFQADLKMFMKKVTGIAVNSINANIID
jgi:hypothetical protein